MKSTKVKLYKNLYYVDPLNVTHNSFLVGDNKVRAIKTEGRAVKRLYSLNSIYQVIEKSLVKHIDPPLLVDMVRGDGEWNSPYSSRSLSIKNGVTSGHKRYVMHMLGVYRDKGTEWYISKALALWIMHRYKTNQADIDLFVENVNKNEKIETLKSEHVDSVKDNLSNTNRNISNETEKNLKESKVEPNNNDQYSMKLDKENYNLLLSVSNLSKNETISDIGNRLINNGLLELLKSFSILSNRS